MKPVRSGIGWVISARRGIDVSVDGAQVSTHSGPCRFYSLTGGEGGGDGGEEGTEPTLLKEGSCCASMGRSMGPVSVQVGREGRGLQGAVGREVAHRHWAW